ncbi:MAG: response regulator [Cyclobacteriaceae bacterium]
MMTCWLIDDNEIDLLITRKLIKNWEPTLSIQEFTNAQVALDKLDNGEEPPQLIFLDLFMPEISGYDFLDHYRQFDYPNTLLYVLSSSIDDADIERVRTYPMVTGYMSKPVSKDGFERIIAKHQNNLTEGLER